MTTYSRYKGPQSYQDDPLDQILFFGRKQEAELLLNRVLSNNLLVLYGQSGAGKSSLINAGLLPKLRKANHFPVITRFNHPSQDPLDALYKQVKKTVEDNNRDYRLDSTIDFTEGDHHTLWEYFKTLKLQKGDYLLTPVIILDQFEEIFTLYPSTARQDLFRSLADVIRGRIPEKLNPSHCNRSYSDDPPEVRFMIALREDFVGQLETLAEVLPSIFHNRFRLTRLNRAQAAEAISNPAKLVDERLSSPPFILDNEALEKVLDFLCNRSPADLAEEVDEIEPYELQLISQYCERTAIQKMNAPEGSSELRLSKDDIGVVARLDEELRRHYENCYTGLTQKERRNLRQLFERGLIGYSGQRISLEVDDIEERYGVMADTLDSLTKNHVLSKEVKGSNVYYELIHDTLARTILTHKENQFLGQHMGIFLALVLMAIVVIATLFVTEWIGKNHLGWWNIPLALLFLIAPFIRPALMLFSAMWRDLWTEIHLKSHDFEKARKLLRKGLRDHGTWRRYYKLGLTYLQEKEKRFPKAIKAFSRALEYADDNANIWLELAQVRLDQGFSQEAEKSALRSVKLQPSESAFILLVNIYRAMGDLAKAREWADRGLEQLPDSSALLCAKARTFLSEEVKEALAIAETLVLKASKIAPENKDVSDILWEIRLKQTKESLQDRRFKDAKGYISDAVTLRPEDIDAAYYNAAVDLAQQDNEAVQHSIARVLQLDDSLKNRLNVLPPEERSNDEAEYTEAEKNQISVGILERIIDCSPKDPEAYAVVAILYSELNRANKALQAVQKAIALKIDEPRYYLQASLLYDKLEKPEQALKAIQAAIALKPAKKDEPIYLGAAAWFLYELGRYQESAAMSLEIFRIDDSSARAWFNYGLVNLCLQQSVEATRAYKQSIELLQNGRAKELSDEENSETLIREAIGDIEKSECLPQIDATDILAELKSALLQIPEPEKETSK